MLHMNLRDLHTVEIPTQVMKKLVNSTRFYRNQRTSSQRSPDFRLVWHTTKGSIPLGKKCTKCKKRHNAKNSNLPFTSMGVGITHLQQEQVQFCASVYLFLKTMLVSVLCNSVSSCWLTCVPQLGGMSILGDLLLSVAQAF